MLRCRAAVVIGRLRMRTARPRRKLTRCARQVDVVGTPEETPSPRRTAGGVRINADGCYVERDPNVATLRALECINL